MISLLPMFFVFLMTTLPLQTPIPARPPYTLSQRISLASVDGKAQLESRGCDGVEVEAAYTFANPSDIVMFFLFCQHRQKSN